MTPPPSDNRAQPALPDFLRSCLRVGLLSFGGPAAQIAVMHREFVEDRAWMEEEDFLSALSFCMMLPGPEAMQLATFSGWRLRGTFGGIISGLFFVLPGALVMLALAAVYAAYGHLPATSALFLGVKATVVLVVLQALVRLGRKALGTRDRWFLAILSFIAIFFIGIPFPAIVICAAVFGWLTWRGVRGPEVSVPSAGHLPRTIAIWGGLWGAPLLFLAGTGQSRLLEIGVFFSKLAVVTFGGAYAVLAYMSQQVVRDKAWLSADAMLDGLGLAETTPGPLILVTEFVGYMAATPLGLWGGVAGAAITLWVTFVPCFLWIFAGAPYIDWIATQPRLSAALKAITASVVGVIASLSLWFAVHVFFATVDTANFGPLHFLFPTFSSVDWNAVALAVIAAALLFILRQGLIVTIATMAIAGLVVGSIF
ncbi:chromate efflux transporter [Celeribacter arenosi]|uniref:Chromate efflux transporter n=1 Tax=Celeribacter arenosi TaxID=792649 RepID=A0ABP7KEW6_9RHOB